MIEGREKVGIKIIRLLLPLRQQCWAVFFLVALSSCFKEKNIAPPKDQTMGQTAVIDMGSDYADQYYYSLATNSVVHYNSRFEYDLMFECKNDRFFVWLNTSKFMSVLNTTKTDLASVSIADSTGKHWFYELGEFSDDSNAIGKWWAAWSNQPASKNEVYLLNLGVDNHGNALGFVKFQIRDFTGTSYALAYSAIGENEVHTALVPKDPTRNYRYFTFANGGSVVPDIEPDKSAWDFCFTRFSVVFYEPYYLPYQVTGVLNNPSKVSAYLDSTVAFNEVTRADFDESRLQTRRDVIGYEWKRYEWGDYTTKTWYTFFIKAGDDEYYKLRFIDFKKNGVWGYPTFEYYRL